MPTEAALQSATAQLDQVRREIGKIIVGQQEVVDGVLICMLAQYLVWHLRRALAPLTYTDEQPPTRQDPVAPAKRSAAAQRKASRHVDEHDQPLHTFRGLLAHLATLTRNDVRYGRDETATVVPTLATSTPTQRRAFELLGAPVPVTLA